LLQKLESYDIDVVGETISLPMGIVTQDKKQLTSREKGRCIEILYWLKEHGPVSNWVVIDDMDLWTHAGPYFYDHMVQTKSLFGLTEADADEVGRCMTSLNHLRSTHRGESTEKAQPKSSKRVTKGLGQSGSANNHAAPTSVPQSRTAFQSRDSKGCMSKIPELYGVNPDVELPPSLTVLTTSDGSFAKPRRASFLKLLFGFR